MSCLGLGLGRNKSWPTRQTGLIGRGRLGYELREGRGGHGIWKKRRQMRGNWSSRHQGSRSSTVAAPQHQDVSVRRRCDSLWWACPFREQALLHQPLFKLHIQTVVSKHLQGRNFPPATSHLALCALFFGFQFSHEAIHIPPLPSRSRHQRSIGTRSLPRPSHFDSNSLVELSITTDLELAKHRVGTTKQ